ncbi:MAG: acyl-CoA thioesterase [Rhodothermales bacterium]
MSENRTVSQSRCTMSEIVLPNDTNNLGNMMGGRLMYLMDICAAISAQRHTNHVCVTAAVDSVEFESPIHQGEIVVIEGQVNRTFRSSLEVELNVWAENPFAQTRRKCNRAYYTFVAINEEGRPVPVPPIHPETDHEHANFEAAARRRELRLVISGRMELKDARLIKEDIIGTLTHRDD